MSYAIEVQNEFVIAKRDVHASRKYRKENGNIVTLQEETIGFPPNEDEVRTWSFNLGADQGDKEFLEIVVANDQVDLGPAEIKFPTNSTPELISAGPIKVTASDNGGNRISLKIRQGIPQWRVKIAMPDLSGSTTTASPDNVSISDDNGGGGPG